MWLHLYEQRADTAVLHYGAPIADSIRGWTALNRDDPATVLRLWWSDKPRAAMPPEDLFDQREGYQVIRMVGDGTGEEVVVGRYRVAPEDIDLAITWGKDVQDRVLALGGLSRHLLLTRPDAPAQFVVVAEYTNLAARDQALKSVAGTHGLTRLDVRRFRGRIVQRWESAIRA